MWYELAANLIALLHFAFLAFVVFGAFLGRRQRTWKYLHIGAMAYGVAIEVFYWPCPLTYVEQYLRRQAGRGAYDEPFIAHYLNQIIYIDLGQGILIVVAAVVLLVNSVLYIHWAKKRRTPVPEIQHRDFA